MMPTMEPDAQRARAKAEARAEAAERELERAHRLLDHEGVLREYRPDGERDWVDYSLEARVKLLLEEE